MAEKVRICRNKRSYVRVLNTGLYGAANENPLFAQHRVPNKIVLGFIGIADNYSVGFVAVVWCRRDGVL